MCESCKYLCHDSCMDGYCSNKLCKDCYSHMVVSDKGCKIKGCVCFAVKGSDKPYDNYSFKQQRAQIYGNRRYDISD